MSGECRGRAYLMCDGVGLKQAVHLRERHVRCHGRFLFIGSSAVGNVFLPHGLYLLHLYIAVFEFGGIEESF